MFAIAFYLLLLPFLFSRLRPPLRPLSTEDGLMNAVRAGADLDFLALLMLLVLLFLDGVVLTMMLPAPFVVGGWVCARRRWWPLG